jgi:hypothetical protein
MLTDTTLKNLKPKTAQYKVTDRDGMYVWGIKSRTLKKVLVEERLHS